MGAFNLAVPFFLPPWRRLALVLFCTGWALVEFLTGAPFWGVLFFAMGVGAAWQFKQTNWREVAEQESSSKAE